MITAKEPNNSATQRTKGPQKVKGSLGSASPISVPMEGWLHQGQPPVGWVSVSSASQGLMLKLKLQYFGHPKRRADSLEKTRMLGKIEGRRRRGRQEDEMVRWHHQLSGHEFELPLGDGGGHRSLVCHGPWGHRELDTTWVWSLCSRPSQDNSLEIPSSGCNSYLRSNTAQPSDMQMPPPPAPASPGTASAGTSHTGPPRSCPHRVTPFRDALVSTITRALRPVPGKS